MSLNFGFTIYEFNDLGSEVTLCLSSFNFKVGIIIKPISKGCSES